LRELIQWYDDYKFLEFPRRKTDLGCRYHELCLSPL